MSHGDPTCPTILHLQLQPLSSRATGWTNSRHELLSTGAARSTRRLTPPHTFGRLHPKSRPLSLAPTSLNFKCRVSGVQTHRALLATPSRPVRGTELSACTPRRWLVTPTRTMWTLLGTARTSPSKPLVRREVPLLNTFFDTPASLSITEVTPGLNLVLTLLIAQLALLIILRSRVEYTEAELRFTLPIITCVIVSGRTTHGLFECCPILVRVPPVKLKVCATSLTPGPRGAVAQLWTSVPNLL